MFRELSLTLTVVVALTLPALAQSCPDKNCPGSSGGCPVQPQYGVPNYPRWNSLANQSTRPRWRPTPRIDEDTELQPTAQSTQRVCPVTGEALGSMGRPVPVTVLGRTIQVCCADCVAAVQRNPQKYLQRVSEELGQVLPAAVPPGNPAAARWNGQTRCPVTDEALGSMGEPIAVRLGERTIAVCCQACVHAVKRNPQRYLQKVDAELPTRQPSYRSPRQTPTLWGGQKTCPVTAEALGDMGTPIPVELERRTIFVCCEACLDAVLRNPAKYQRRVSDELKTLAR